MSERDAEVARAHWLELSPAGFEEVVVGNGRVELVAYTDRAGEARIRAVFPEVVVRVVEDGWADRWREFHRPVRVAGLWIGPPWEAAPESEPTVVVDPGRAFGTGAHPTTRACIELLSELERGGVLDAGCGSGVVAVAAVRLGFAPVVAVDIDAAAVEAARETVRRNGVVVQVREDDVLRGEFGHHDVVVANIELDIVEQLLARGPATRAVTSGYLAGEVPNVPGWRPVASIELDGWAAHALEAK